MTEELRSIWKKVDHISDYDIADKVELNALQGYLEENCYIIPEEDWDEIQTRGYGLSLMMWDADEHHKHDASWQNAVNESFNDLDWNIDLHGNATLAEFWRGYPAGTLYEEIVEA